ncbi:MAG: hypothetical protein AB1728_15235 [Bacteroidota bacterium]
MAKRKNDALKVNEPLVSYFERTDLGERLLSVEPVSADIKITNREYIVSVDKDIAKSLSRIAKKRKVTSTSLLQQWVKEKVVENSIGTK